MFILFRTQKSSLSCSRCFGAKKVLYCVHIVLGIKEFIIVLTLFLGLKKVQYCFHIVLGIKEVIIVFTLFLGQEFIIQCVNIVLGLKKKEKEGQYCHCSWAKILYCCVHTVLDLKTFSIRLVLYLFSIMFALLLAVRRQLAGDTGCR